MNRGFTIIELVISVGIFVVITSLVVSKYGNFNQSVLLTDTAYDIALVVRLSQTYGLSVKNSGSGGSLNFNLPYGVSFNDSTTASCGTASSNSSTLVLFNDSYPVGSADGSCTSNDANINTYVLTRGASISRMCVGTDHATCSQPSGVVTRLDVSYQRPNPEAVICASAGGAAVCNQLYSEVTIRGTDASTRTIVIKQNGQISVEKE